MKLLEYKENIIEYKKKMYCFYFSYEKKFFKISKEKKRKRNLEI